MENVTLQTADDVVDYYMPDRSLSGKVVRCRCRYSVGGRDDLRLLRPD